MRKILTITLSLILLLCGCYRQTTVILQQGETLPKASTAAPAVTGAATDTTAPSSVPLEPTDTDSNTTKTEKPSQQSSSKPSSGKNPPEPTVPETTVSAEATVPETTVPAETTIPQTAASAEITAPTETAVPETTAPAATEPELTQPSVYDISNHRTSSFDRSILDELNRHRESAGVAPLSLNSKLSALAAIRAYECSQEWGHARPDGRGWATVLSDYGYSASPVAENILYASSGTDASALAEAWMGSDSHKGKIIDSSFSVVGVGTFDANGYVYVVTIFAG